jgi:hypothetical protein
VFHSSVAAVAVGVAPPKAKAFDVVPLHLIEI